MHFFVDVRNVEALLPGGNLTIFKEEMNLLCQVLSTMAFDLDLVEDDDYANVELIFRMEIFYTTFILNQLVPMVRAELSNSLTHVLVMKNNFDVYATVIKLGGANIFKLNSIETVLMDTAGAFEHLLVSEKKTLTCSSLWSQLKDRLLLQKLSILQKY